jgi:DNA repair exonuclease SbcCD ATPase subunit
MKINKLELTNLKGQNKTYELEHTNLLVGPYGSGKSSVIQALKFLIGGTFTDGETVRKTGEEIAKMASGDLMKVLAETDNGNYMRGIEIKRKVTLEGVDVKYSQIADVSNRYGEKTLKEFTGRIASDFGVDAATLNISEFTKLSAAEQKKYIFNLYPPNADEWTVDKIVSYLSGKFNESGFLNDARPIINNVAAQCVEEGVNRALEAITERFNELNAQKKRDEIGMQELTAIKQKNQESVKGLAAAKIKQKEYMNRIQELTTEIANVKQLNVEHEQKVKDIAELTLKIGLLKESLNDYDKENLQTALEFNQKMITRPMTKPFEFEKAKLEESISLLDKEVELYIAEVKVINDNYDVLENGIKSINSEIENCNEKLKTKSVQYDALKLSLDTVSKFNGACPISTCVKCCTDMTPAIAELNESILEIVTTMDLFEIAKNELLNELELQNQEFETIKDKLAATTLNWRDKEKELNLATVALEKNEHELNAHLQQIEKNNMIVEMKIKDLEHSISTMDSQIFAINVEIAHRASEIKSLSEKQTKEYDVQLLVDELNATTEHLDNINQQIKDKVKAKSDLENLAIKEKESQEVLQQWTIYKLMKECVGQKGLAGQMIITAIEPMISGIQENLNALGVESKFCIDTENFNLILDDEGVKRSYETLSNGETLIMNAAILIEFMQKTCRTRILLLDNINDIDLLSSEQFIEGVSKLKHKYDVCIMATNQDVKNEINGVKTFRL